MSETSQTETNPAAPEAARPTAANVAPDPATAPGPNTGTATAESLAAVRAEAAAAQERHLRAVADLENFRKRALREKDELRQFATARLMEDLIPVLDSLALALAAARQPAQTDASSIADGVAMVLEQFKSTLSRHGMKEIDPQGQTFDPNQHDCIAHQPDPQDPAETVTRVVRLGYSLNGRLLRPASVVVSSGPAVAEQGS